MTNQTHVAAPDSTPFVRTAQHPVPEGFFAREIVWPTTQERFLAVFPKPIPVFDDAR